MHEGIPLILFWMEWNLWPFNLSFLSVIDFYLLNLGALLLPSLSLTIIFIATALPNLQTAWLPHSHSLTADSYLLMLLPFLSKLLAIKLTNITFFHSFYWSSLELYS